MAKKETSGHESSMRPFVVVLTGGPCAGKTSATAFLRDRLSKRGFQVLTVPENATHFLTNSDGFQPEWAGTDSQVRMQRIFLDYQMSQEDAFKAFGELHPTKPSVLLLDCCTLNSKVYLTDEQWSKVLTLPGKPVLTEQQLFARYDLVIHMVSCAFEGQYDWGPGSSNPGRYHSPEEAKDHDKRSLNVFAHHPQVRVVPHFEEFDSKMQQVLHFLNEARHMDGLTGKRRRQQVRVADTNGLLAIAAQASTSSFLVTSTFLDEQMQQSLRRRATISNKIWLDNFRRLRSHGELSRTSSFDDIEAIREEHDVMYERRSHAHMPCPSGGEEKTYLTRRIIKQDDYYVAVESPGPKFETVKFVMSFMIDSSYYELFFFPSYKDPVLDLGDDIERPPAWLEVIDNDQCQDMVSPVKASAMDTEASIQQRAEARSASPPDTGPNLKRPRVLVRYTTQEAAFENPSMA
jgi:hypothetical protein